MWLLYLIGGLSVMTILLTALPILIVTGVGALVDLLSRTEYEDASP